MYEFVKKNRVVVHVILFLLTAGIGNFVIENYMRDTERKIEIEKQLSQQREIKQKKRQDPKITWDDEPLKSIKRETIALTPLINKAHGLTGIMSGIRISESLFKFPANGTRTKDGFVIVEYNDLTPTGKLPKYEFEATLFFGDVFSDLNNTINLRLSFVNKDTLGKASSVVWKKDKMVKSDFVTLYGKLELARVNTSVKGNSREWFNYRKQPLS